MEFHPFFLRSDRLSAAFSYLITDITVRVCKALTFRENEISPKRERICHKTDSSEGQKRVQQQFNMLVSDIDMC
jgi:hypothetical protein